MDTPNTLLLLEPFPLAEALRLALYRAADLDAAMADTERRHATCLAQVTADTLTATGADGKPLYTNDAARRAAVDLAVFSAPHCHDLAARLEDLKRQRALALADAEALRVAARLHLAMLPRD